ncbi:signal transduction histidine kinase [Thioploca ingrica]|uniref:histidine kinase n=1 Tax=Thioploca ingrica TaxID=40754 RepID=A0A090BV51_9GAMM|nr:signal transduction histidine kinase [Thioploca ingrica]
MYLRSKLLLQSIVVVVFLSVTSGGIGFFYTYYVAHISMKLVETEAIPILKIKSLEKIILEIWLRLILHSSVTDEETMQRVKRELSELEQKLNERMKQVALRYLQMGTADESSRQPWFAFQETEEKFTDIIHQVLHFSDDYDKKEAMQLVISGAGWTTYQQMTDSLSTLIESHQKRMEALRDSALSAQQNAAWAITFLTTLVGLIALVLITRLTRQLIQPLVHINTQLKALSQGKLIEEVVVYRAQDEIGEIVHSSQQLKEGMKTTIAQAHAIATGNYNTEIKRLSQEDQLGQALIDMTQALQQATIQKAKQDWIKTGQTQLNDCISGEQNIIHLTENIINFLTPYLEAQIGAFYLYQAEETQPPYLKMIASHAYIWRHHSIYEFKMGEGIVGQAGLERKLFVITKAPPNYITISSGLGEALPNTILVAPFLYENQLKGVIELASFATFTELHLEFLNQVLPNIAIAVNTAESRTQMQILLEKSQTQAEALQSQQLELQQSNDRLTKQAEELQHQSEELQAQQEELRQINEELEIRTRDLERQQAAIQEKNAVLEKTKLELQTKANELELASKYKSEFLANMSHELRTPLNSLLILAQLLADNKDNNLTATQIKYANTIHNAGSDLLSLINDILDLSKVEAGKVEIHPEEILFTDLIDSLEQKFSHIAEEKGINFTIQLAEDLPESWYTDSQRLIQVINNLLANAFKFTSQGGITVNISRPRAAANLSRSHLDPHTTIAIQVTDTGIGIPADKQKVIFEAFQQADGTTSRRYGGTGLGLSISRQLVQLLGGEIQLQSEMGQGSTFTCYFPERIQTDKTLTPRSLTRSPTIASQPAPAIDKHSLKQSLDEVTLPPQPPPNDDRDNLTADDKVLLIVEDDHSFAQVLMEIAHEKFFKCLLATDGDMGLQLAATYQPHAIILDLGLPQVDGWSVMEQLKDNPVTRHIPVHFVSGTDESKDAKKMGAIGYCLKPVSMAQLSDAFKHIETFITKTVKDLLVIVDDQQRQQAILHWINSGDVQTTVVTTEAEAQQQLQSQHFDCIVLDVSVGKNTGLQWLEQLHNEIYLAQMPVIIYAERELTSAEEAILQKYHDILTIKKVYSPERLVDEVTLFLHQIESQLPQEHQQLLHKVRNKEAILTGKKVLIVDDDVRNVFALAATLEDKGMEIVVAHNGQEALPILETQTDISVILMDIMMPGMDGYETIRQIRSQVRFRKLPIIALTAKAMKGDKAKCIEAGASDYLAKPFDANKLLSLLRVWLHR